jgi:hypothetical protein
MKIIIMGGKPNANFPYETYEDCTLKEQTDLGVAHLLKGTYKTNEYTRTQIAEEWFSRYPRRISSTKNWRDWARMAARIAKEIIPPIETDFR